MEKFTVLPNRTKKSITGVDMVSHNYTPVCEIEIIDLCIQQAKEEMDDLPSRRFRFIDTDKTVYRAELRVIEMQGEGDFKTILRDCWNWWLAHRIRENTWCRFSGN